MPPKKPHKAKDTTAAVADTPMDPAVVGGSLISVIKAEEEVSDASSGPGFMPKDWSDRDKELFYLFWNLFTSVEDSQHYQVENLVAITNIFIELEVRGIAGSTQAERNACWAIMLQEAKISLATYKITYPRLQLILVKLSLDDWQHFVDAFCELLKRRGYQIQDILIDPILTPAFKANAMLHTLESLGITLESTRVLVIIFKEWARLSDCGDKNAPEQSQEQTVDFVKKIQNTPKLKAAHEELLAKIAALALPKQQGLYKTLFNILGTGDQAQVIVDILQADVDAFAIKTIVDELITEVTSSIFVPTISGGITTLTDPVLAPERRADVEDHGIKI